MAPQGLSVVLHSHNMSKSDTINIARDEPSNTLSRSIINTAGSLFTLALPPSKKKRGRKRKSVDAPQTPISKKKRKRMIAKTSHDVIVIDSDSECNRDDSSKLDDDVVVLNIPVEEIVLSDSDCETIMIRKTTESVSQPSCSETIAIQKPVFERSCNESVTSNIVINIDQTVSIDNIVNSALDSNASESNDRPVETKQPGIISRDNVLKWARAKGYPKSWTKDMIKFYTDPCEEKRSFDYVEILKNLKTKPSDWKINNADMMGPTRKRRNYIQCRRCDKIGHTEAECSKTYVCYSCGEYNHTFYDCPNTFCLTCGRPAATKNLRNCFHCRKALARKKPCGLCGQIYHEEVLCPSKWRKHLKLNPPTQPIRLNPRKSCYNCSRAGHFGFECPFTSYSDYPPENPLKTSFYEDSLREHENPQNEGTVILLSEETNKLLRSEQGNQFLKRVSESMNARIEMFRGAENYVRIIGEEVEVDLFRAELQLLKFSSGGA